MLTRRAPSGWAGQLAAMLAGLWLAFGPAPGQAAADSLLCGFLTGLGGTERSLGALVTSPNETQARELARSESMKLTFSFARFTKWYPEIAGRVKPYYRSRQRLYRILAEEGRTAMLRAYAAPASRQLLDDMEKRFAENDCKSWIDRESLMHQADIALRDGTRGRHIASPTSRRAVDLLLVAAFFSMFGIGYAIWREARARHLARRHIVRLPIEIEHLGMRLPGRANDIGRRGARLFFVDGHMLEPKQSIRVVWKDIWIDSRVRWTGPNVAGVEFRSALTQEQLMRMLAASERETRVRRRARTAEERRRLVPSTP
ncbi:PilZ domain-containing protein [Tropicimonas sp. IMCC6043]|uniref:PilZ domain-containing protein n=1 Tax=Tropicimonas sp. IMCC6043 TaxID=2510645 RepID=UPI00101DAA21|nr:PilZ domain-containing protein [Tropicimonas sp. IMCC6043]RYH10098.1 hypothetical protein EU800_09425 [Tropicimonas sp. IMCC6043]